MNKDICTIIASYIINHKYKLLNWISEDKLNKKRLSLNINSIDYINHDDINWINISGNKNAMNIINKNKDNIYWNNLSYNKNAIELLKKNQDKINWHYMTINKNIFKKSLDDKMIENVSNVLNIYFR